MASIPVILLVAGTVFSYPVLIFPCYIFTYVALRYPLGRLRRRLSKPLIAQKTATYPDQSIYAYEKYRYRVYGEDLPQTMTFYYLRNPRYAYIDSELCDHVPMTLCAHLLVIPCSLLFGIWLRGQQEMLSALMVQVIEYLDKNVLRQVYNL